MTEDGLRCRQCGAELARAHASGLCPRCREAHIAAAHKRLARMQRHGLVGMGAGALVIGGAASWAKAGGGLAAFWLAGAGGLMFFGGGFAWLVAWGVRAWHRDAVRAHQERNKGD